MARKNKTEDNQPDRSQLDWTSVIIVIVPALSTIVTTAIATYGR